MNPLVDISVSGTPFTVPRSVLTGREWVLSKIPDGDGDDVPWGAYHEGRYYVDADPAAFRWALHFIRCGSLPDEVASDGKEMGALRALADFLCYEDLVKHIDARLNEKQKANVERNASFVNRIETMDGYIAPCDEQNCHKKIIMLWDQGNESVAKSWKCVCGHENNCEHYGKYSYSSGTKLWGKRTKTSFDDLSKDLGLK